MRKFEARISSFLLPCISNKLHLSAYTRTPSGIPLRVQFVQSAPFFVKPKRCTINVQTIQGKEIQYIKLNQILNCNIPNEEIRSANFFFFVALYFEQTSPLGVHSYAFGYPLTGSVCPICTIFRQAQKMYNKCADHTRHTAFL